MPHNVPKAIIFHCTDVATSVSKNQFFAVNQYHKERWNGETLSSLGFYGGYHVIIGNGKEYRYREDWEEGAHCNQIVDGKTMNDQSLGVCWMGDGDEELPSPQDVALIKSRIEAWMQKYNIPIENILNHRRFAQTKTCPGTLISNTWAQELVSNIAPQPKDPEQQAKKEKIAQLQGLLDQLKELLYRYLGVLQIRK